MNNGINLVFYSRTCTTCQNLLKILQTENLLHYFRLYCIDDKLDKLPINIEIVPTIIVANIGRPLVAKEAFEWVQYAKFTNTQTNSPIKNTTNRSSYLAWNKNEMDGISDGYAYKDVDSGFVHSYQGTKDDNNIIFTAPETGKMNKNDQDKLIKNITSKRQEQDIDHLEKQKKSRLGQLLQMDKQNKL
jgi:hypothetical protein